MTDFGRRTETLRVGKPFTAGTLAILPIERIVWHAHCAKTGAWFSVAKAPRALVLSEAGGIRIVDIDAGAVSLDALRERIPGFDAALSAMRCP